MSKMLKKTDRERSCQSVENFLGRANKDHYDVVVAATKNNDYHIFRNIRVDFTAEIYPNEEKSYKIRMDWGNDSPSAIDVTLLPKEFMTYFEYMSCFGKGANPVLSFNNSWHDNFWFRIIEHGEGQEHEKLINEYISD